MQWGNPVPETGDPGLRASAQTVQPEQTGWRIAANPSGNVPVRKSPTPPPITRLPENTRTGRLVPAPLVFSHPVSNHLVPSTNQNLAITALQITYEA